MLLVVSPSVEELTKRVEELVRSANGIGRSSPQIAGPIYGRATSRARELRTRDRGH